MGSQKPLSYSTPNMRRSERNVKEAENLRNSGFSVYTSPEYPNNAYYAIERGSRHFSHEEEVCKIAAENGLSAVLDKEGTVKLRTKVGNTIRAVSLDGKIENFTHEIMALNGKPNARKVADGIAHTYKKNVISQVQADIAITITPLNSTYKTSDILNGVKEFKRRANAGEALAKPLINLHIDERTRKIYVNKLR